MSFRNHLTLIIVCCISAIAFAQQNISGSFPELAGQQVKLVGFQDFGIYTIDSTLVSTKGIFELQFAERDFGMGYLVATDHKPYFVVLTNENVALKGKNLSIPENITVLSGKVNQTFATYASERPRREQALSAWDYLSKLYSQDLLFKSEMVVQKTIEKERKRIKEADSLVIASLPSNSYLKWYLPKRKLVGSVSFIAQYKPEEIPATKQAFRTLDYSDDRLYKSGLLRDAIENHVWLIENTATSLDSAFKEMNISIDAIINSVKHDTENLNKITDFLFKLLEKHSLFKASEYLALKVLNLDNCTINDNLASQLESYRAMKVGNTAPDINFDNEVFAPGYKTANTPKKLSEIKTKYTLVVFGASWCPACANELLEVSNYYSEWKKQGVEVVFVSLDDNAEKFKNFIKPFQFISLSDFKKWESPIVKDYHVFATPTMFLLNGKREIILRPHSAEQMNSWIDWFLVKGNK